MRNPSHKPVDRDALLVAIRSAVKAAGGERIGIMQFMDVSKIGRRDIYRYYTCWNEALVAAGFDFEPYNEPLPPERLLADWGLVARKLKRIPNLRAYNIHGNYDGGTFRKRFGSWINARRAFRDFAAGKAEWADVLAFCPRLPPGARSRGPVPGRRRIPRRLRAHRPIYGAPLDLPGLRNAPINESGVIFLFGILAHRLGFQIEAIRTAFPDCEAKRLVAPGTWQNVTIEFEYMSSNFREHGHPPQGCDIIICWRHNWSNCPKTLEVIALDEELKRLAITNTNTHVLTPT